MAVIMTREEARLRRLRHYNTGLPCLHGHHAPRYVESTRCVECELTRARKNTAAKRQHTMRQMLFDMVAVTVQVPRGDEAALKAYAEYLIRLREAKRDYRPLG